MDEDGAQGYGDPDEGFDGGCVVFEKHKERLHESEVALASAAWSDEVAELQTLLALVDATGTIESSDVILRGDERLLGHITNVGLIGQVRGPGHYQGGSQGISIPVGSLGGRSVRYRVGATRGHYVQGATSPAAVDHGSVSITTQRVIYQGAAKTAECPFAKVLGIQHAPGEITISVSNRQKPTVLYFGPELDDWVSNRLNLALAIYAGRSDQERAELRSRLDALLKSKPTL